MVEATFEGAVVCYSINSSFRKTHEIYATYFQVLITGCVLSGNTVAVRTSWVGMAAQCTWKHSCLLRCCQGTDRSNVTDAPVPLRLLVMSAIRPTLRLMTMTKDLADLIATCQLHSQAYCLLTKNGDRNVVLVTSNQCTCAHSS